MNITIRKENLIQITGVTGNEIEAVNAGMEKEADGV